jgi:hypothetical protein
MIEIAQAIESLSWAVTMGCASIAIVIIWK